MVRWGAATQAVFWKPGTVEVGSVQVSVNQGCVLMVGPTESGLALTVANPNQLSESIEIVVERGGEAETVVVDYPKGGMAGSSVTVEV